VTVAINAPNSKRISATAWSRRRCLVLSLRQVLLPFPSPWRRRRS